eukprot:TRINITY_DN2805_c2_g1_i1.p1 TRINITY_DN2805_c2_g1~~TRINITY_DN2805_c2_g1_i1.p1  ORF type:complete len:176 (-),score=20.27 TRINITY_DN2805_c2_g1_i1:797-1246(-)
MINVGETLTWIWGDSLYHTVTNVPNISPINKRSMDAGFNSPNDTAPFSFSFTFNTAGFYYYQDDNHPNYMTGSVLVVVAPSRLLHHLSQSPPLFLLLYLLLHRLEFLKHLLNHQMPPLLFPYPFPYLLLPFWDQMKSFGNSEFLHTPTL